MGGAVTAGAGRCAACQATVDRMRGQGFTYSAFRVSGGPWEVSFRSAADPLGDARFSRSAPTLHEALADIASAAARRAGGG